jgi:phosphoadenosine phosphosulfate reductase
MREHSKFSLVKISPLVNWSEREVWQYISAHQVPYNRPHERTFSSIECIRCTRPIAQGEDLGDGRWSEFEKTACGPHTPA